MSSVNGNKITVAVDAMGTDNAPVSEVEGSVLAVNADSNLKILLVGQEEKIRSVLAKQKFDNDSISVINSTEIVTMHESPADVYKKKKDSSINVGLNLQKNGKADAFISAGNTGAVMTASLFILGRISNISRPTIGSIFPTDSGITVVFDVGANVDSKPIHLLEFAVMGDIFTRYIYNVDNPRVALLNVGEEKSKGNSAVVEAYELLEKSGLNFIGNVEGRDILKGKAEVIVCDGFTGNIVLKFTESVLDVLKNKFRKYAEENFFQKIWVGMMYKTLRKILKDFDYQEYGGVPLLGVNGVSIIGHGRSTPKAIFTMINRAVQMVKVKVNEHIREKVSDIKLLIPKEA